MYIPRTVIYCQTGTSSYLSIYLLFISICSYLKEAKEIHDQIGNEVDEYVSHPINAFHLSKRLHLRWSVLVDKTLEENLPHKGKFLYVFANLFREKIIITSPK